MNAPDRAPLRLTEFSHGGGCGCKIAPAVLRQILGSSGSSLIPKELLVGVETSDDAAVFQLNERQAVVATTDFFMPIVDDPYDFGMIAATNAISDVYAMGGTPLFALALVGMPIDKLPVETIRRILDGGEAVCARAGIPIAGGHTIDSVEPIYGLVVIGLVDPKHLKRNAGAQPGDALVLGKPLGIGVYSAALKRGALLPQHYAAMLASTTRLNTPGIAFGTMPAVHALTDVTGFGLIGHLLEICRASSAGADDRVRARAGASRCARPCPSGHRHRRVRAQLGRLRGCGHPDAPRQRRRARVVDRSANVGRPAGRVRTGCGRRRPGRLPGRRIRRCRDRRPHHRGTAADRRALTRRDGRRRHVPRRHASRTLRPWRRAPPSDSIPLPISG